MGVMIITSSFPAGSHSWLWSVLSNNVPPCSWRAAVSAELVASYRTGYDKNGAIARKHIISTGFQGVAMHETDQQPAQPLGTRRFLCLTDSLSGSIPLYSEDYLKKLSVTELKEICKLYNIKGGKTFELHSFTNHIPTSSHAQESRFEPFEVEEV
jgi:hypothetical protein